MEKRCDNLKAILKSVFLGCNSILVSCSCHFYPWSSRQSVAELIFYLPKNLERQCEKKRGKKGIKRSKTGWKGGNNGVVWKQGRGRAGGRKRVETDVATVSSQSVQFTIQCNSQSSLVQNWGGSSCRLMQQCNAVDSSAKQSSMKQCVCGAIQRIAYCNITMSSDNQLRCNAMQSN